MDSGLRQEILSILKAAGEMTVATVRADGYPNAGRHDTQRVSSREMPPPGTIMCTCG
jgi:hypothetical protein